MIDLRLRTRLSDEGVKPLAGKVLGPDDYDVLLTGRAFVRMPNGKPLCCYLPGALHEAVTPDIYGVLHSLRTQTTSNRGLASGTRRVKRGSGEHISSRTEARSIASSVVGAVDPMGQTLYCRLTAWTGRHLPQWETVHPLLRAIATAFEAHLPDRYNAQMRYVERTDPSWVVPGTPFTTITVNNSYPTGVHTDKGDLDEGFSTLACIRRGEFTGGELIFPQFRVAVDMHDGDLLLMDAHQWHGNVPVRCDCGHQLNGPCPDCAAERISVVSYYRTRMAECGTASEEQARALELAERRSARSLGETASAEG